MLRQIDKLMLDAVRNKRDWKNSNTAVVHQEHQTRVVLHSTPIAEIDWNSKQIVVRTGGWNTPTTKSRLNAIIRTFTASSGIYQLKGQWVLAEEPFEGEMTLSLN